jgi:hypothetical protein
VIKSQDEWCFQWCLAKKQCHHYMYKWISPDQPNPVQDSEPVDMSSLTRPSDWTGACFTANWDHLEWWNHWLALHSQIYSPVVTLSQSHLTIYSHACSCMLDLETCWAAGLSYQKVGGMRSVVGGVWLALGSWWCIVAKFLMSVDIIVWTYS